MHYQDTFWCQIRREERQKRDMGACVYHPSATSQVCTPAGRQTAEDHGPWRTEGYGSSSGGETQKNGTSYKVDNVVWTFFRMAYSANPCIALKRECPK